MHRHGAENLNQHGLPTTMKSYLSTTAYTLNPYHRQAVKQKGLIFGWYSIYYLLIGDNCACVCVLCNLGVCCVSVCACVCRCVSIWHVFAPRKKSNNNAMGVWSVVYSIFVLNCVYQDLFVFIEGFDVCVHQKRSFFFKDIQ